MKQGARRLVGQIGSHRTLSSSSSSSLSSVSFEPRSLAFIQNPYPKLKELRETNNGMHWSKDLDGWVVTKYDDVRSLLGDNDRLTADRLRPGLVYLENKALKVNNSKDAEMFRKLRETFQSWVVFNDPPDHTRLRKLMDKAFRKRVIMNLRSKIESAATSLLQEAIDKNKAQGKMEFTKDFANPLPARVIADLLGIPHEDMGKLVDWSNGIAGFVLVSRNDKDKYLKAYEALENLRAYFSAKIEERKQIRKIPDEELNVLDGMIRASEGADKMSIDELIASSILLIFAGHETTTHLIANGVNILCSHPNLMELIQQRAGEEEEKKQKAKKRNGEEQEEQEEEEVSCFKNMVEEVLRFDGPSLANVRVAKKEFALQENCLVKPKDRLFLFSAAANRDAAHFEAPDEFQLDRKNAKRNLTFGYGKHFCIGAPLARLEGEIAFREIIKRFKKVKLNGEASELVRDSTTNDLSPPFVDLIVTRGMKALPIEFELK